ncbi:MAG: hypothetical protein EZS28_043451, partial [Streblomastix strix]
MNIPQKGHLAAQSADGLGFQPLIGPEQEQSEDEPEQAQRQQDLNNHPNNPENESSSGLKQETRRCDANKVSIKPRPKSSLKKNNGRWQRQLRLRTAHADVGLEALTGGATTKDPSLEELNLSITTTTEWKTHEIHHSLGNNQFQERLQQTIAQCPFQGNQTEMQAQKAMLLEKHQEGIIKEIPKEQFKSWNPTFLVPKPSGDWRKILDASLLNEEIQLLHFQMNEVEQVPYLLIPNDWAVIIDLKSAFHHLIVYPPHGAYLAFEVDNHHYQQRAMPFGCKHSPIFFTQALTLLLTEIRKRTDIRIINYSDDITIALNKCQLTPKQETYFLGQIWNMSEMNNFMTKSRRHQLIEQIKKFNKNIQRHKIIKIKETAALIGRLNFLRTQFKEASLYLMLIDSTKTRAVKTKGWTGMMISPLEVLKELYWWIKKIAE